MMLLGGDRKKVISIIVGGMQPGFVGRDNGAMEGEYKTPGSEAKEAQLECATSLIEAINSGDAEGVVKAFMDLKTLCEGGDDLDEAL